MENLLQSSPEQLLDLPLDAKTWKRLCSDRCSLITRTWRQKQSQDTKSAENVRHPTSGLKTPWVGVALLMLRFSPALFEATPPMPPANQRPFPDFRMFWPPRCLDERACCMWNLFRTLVCQMRTLKENCPTKGPEYTSAFQNWWLREPHASSSACFTVTPSSLLARSL